MIQKWFSPLAGALMAAVLLMAGCSNPIDSAEQNSSAFATVQLSLASGNPRTLFPDVSLTGLLFEIDLVTGGREETLDIPWDGSGTQILTGPPGTWTITVTGYVTEGTTRTSVSQGRAIVTVPPDTSPVRVSIGLTWLETVMGNGSGTLRYGGLTLPPLSNLASGTLTLKTEEGMLVATRSLLADYTATSAITDLSAGYYILTLKLTKTDGSCAIKSEIVHIYTGRTTKITDSAVFTTFRDDDFAMP